MIAHSGQMLSAPGVLDEEVQMDISPPLER